MEDLPYIDDPEVLKLELRRLIALREGGKQPRPRGRALSRTERQAVHSKTDGRCHVCGELVPLDGFEADHVKNHTSGGASMVDNYLPACAFCNGYRWHYLPHELQWIMKLGIWAKTQIDRETPIGKSIAKGFVSHERNREARRKTSRLPHHIESLPSQAPSAPQSDDLGFGSASPSPEL
jgi:hypothetical protein